MSWSISSLQFIGVYVPDPELYRLSCTMCMVSISGNAGTAFTVDHASDVAVFVFPATVLSRSVLISILHCPYLYNPLISNSVECVVFSLMCLWCHPPILK